MPKAAESELSDVPRSLPSPQILILGAVLADPTGILPILVTESISQNVSQEMYKRYQLPVFERFSRSCGF